MTHCTGPECTRPVVAHGLCPGHYKQLKQLKTLTPLRTEAKGAQVAFRCTTELKARAVRDAQRLGIRESEWWIRAGEEKLK